MDFSYVVTDPSEGLDPRRFAETRRDIVAALSGKEEVAISRCDLRVIREAAQSIDRTALDLPPRRAEDLGVDPRKLAVSLGSEVENVLACVLRLFNGPVGRVAAATELRVEMAWVLVALCSLQNILDADCGSGACGEGSDSLRHLSRVFPDDT